jgi:hypothetical protein
MIIAGHLTVDVDQRNDDVAAFADLVRGLGLTFGTNDETNGHHGLGVLGRDVGDIR